MRYMIVVAAVFMQMCLGATYSWSIYVQPIRLATDLQQGPAQIPFTVFYFIFPLTMLVAGSLLPRIGPRICAMSGGFFFGGGWLLASFGAENFIFTILGIGVLSGVGAGLAYIVPIAVCTRWFPENKGLVTGVAVAGFGGGAALVSQVGGWLLNSIGMGPFETFLVFGFVFMTTIILAGTVMKFPASVEQKSTRAPLGIREILNTPLFRVLYMAMFIGLAAGFAINANLKDLYGGGAASVQLGITGVSLFALANAAGRIVWGLIFDRVSSAFAVQANLSFQALVLLSAPALLNSPTGFLMIAAASGFNYGGVLVIYVSSASRCWGSERLSQVYGWLFSSNVPASISPIAAGLIFDTFHSFDMALYALSALLVAGVVVVHRRAADFASATHAKAASHLKQ